MEKYMSIHQCTPPGSLFQANTSLVDVCQHLLHSAGLAAAMQSYRIGAATAADGLLINTLCRWHSNAYQSYMCTHIFRKAVSQITLVPQQDHHNNTVSEYEWG